MNIIVTVDNCWAIGNGRGPVIRIPNDQKKLLRETAGKAVVMGRRALEHLPQGLPYGHCDNIVLSRDPSYRVRGAVAVHSLEELFEATAGYRDEDIYVLGGESVYRLLLPYCSTAHITKVDWEYAADRYFPDLDREEDWVITAESDEQTYFDVAYRFVRYERRGKGCMDDKGREA